ncbi:glycosyltransferase family 39 protein [Candidatus Curtissbacteria bacterium]|nr:glycosyltransferase family 39 protein [Candidatus Curtissbacteria bacterium]
MLESKSVKLFFSRSFLAVAALLVLSLFALKDLAKPGFYTSHDGETHTARMAQYWQALAHGQIPPRFAGSLYNGLGSPILTYIYPLPYLAGSAVHALGFSFSDSFEIIMGLGFIFSGIFSYLWLREITKSEKSAFLGALFYTWVPYRFLLIYVRGSLSEVLAYTFLPLLLYCLTRLAKNPNWASLAGSAIITALVLLSQNLVAVISLPIVFFYLVISSIQNKSPKAFFAGVLSIAWGLAISSFTYLPSIFERKFTRLDEIITIAYPDHFVSLKQLIRSPWGYGFDLPGTVNDQISLQIGLIHIFVLFVSLFTTAYLVKKGKFPTTAIYFIFIFAIASFLMLQNKITSSVWQQFKPLHFIDIPWRLLGVTALSLSYLAAYSAKHIKPGLYFLILAAFVLAANRNHLRINQSVVKDDAFFQLYPGTATQYDEFTPVWRQSTRVPIGFDRNIPVELVSGDADITGVSAKSNEVTFGANVTSAQTQIRINKFYFPGWNVEVDGARLTPFDNLTVTDTATLLLDREQDASGLMMVTLERGGHQVKARFGETRLRLAADLLSLGAFLGALLVVTRLFVARNRARNNL